MPVRFDSRRIRNLCCRSAQSGGYNHFGAAPVQPSVIRVSAPQLISELNAPAFGIEDVLIPAHFSMRGHTHDQPHLCMVLDGAFAESGRIVSAGMLRLSPAGDAHDIDFMATGARCFLVTFNDALAFEAPLPAGPRFQDSASIQPIIDRLTRAGEHANVVAAELLVLETLARLTARTATIRKGDPPRWLTHVRQALDDRPFDPPATEFLAREASLHPVYVARAFRAWYGCSLATYSRLLRLDRAIRLLLESRESLAHIAALAGFADQSHFTRAVRARTGVTPRALRATQVSRVQDFRVAAG